MPRDWKKIRLQIGPLRYQFSESDCVPTTVANGLLFLLRRRIHPRLLQMIWSVSLETRHGTGCVACHTLSSILNNWFSSAHEDGYEREEMPYTSGVIEGVDVHLKRNNALTRTLNADGICFVATRKGGHFILLHTVASRRYIGFDPYLNIRKGALDQRRVYDEYSGLANVVFSREELEAELKTEENQWVHIVEPVVLF